MQYRFPPLILIVVALTIGPLTAFSQSLVTLPLWPGEAPGETGYPGEEVDMTKPTDKMVGGKRVVRLGNVSRPTVTIYPAPKDKDTGTAVVVCPGGGYHILAMDLEGTEVCEWLNSIGVTGVLLKYRVPATKGSERHAAPLQDAQRALGLVRSRAKEWNLQADRIGILGFSAGGHLAAALSTNYDQRTYPQLDAADQISCRPDFTIIIYPAYLTRKDAADAISSELKLTAKTPPTFLLQTEDDPVRVENSLHYYLALKQAQVPAELHIYPVGGHGYGLRATDQTVTKWPVPAQQWMQSLGVLTRKP